MRNQENKGEDVRWSSSMLRISATNPISLILIFLIATDLSILLNIPVFRQILGFVFLAFIPGALFLCILKPDALGLTEKFVLSVGLSISFVMFIGILVNTLYPLFGYETPLSLISIVFSFTAVILLLTVVARERGQLSFFFKRVDLKLDTKDKGFIIIPLVFPILSILGMHMMNVSDNSVMLMALLFLIPGYVIAIAMWHNQVPEKIYPIVIFICSISLVLLMGMRFSHIIGTDSHIEYLYFQQTLSNEKWQILYNSTLDSCLSISILPTIYQSFLNTNPEYLFKILYPLLFSISPLVVYLISNKYIGNISAFLASVFFISQDFFLFTTAVSRTNIAILFFALSIMVLVNSRICEFNKKLIVILFIFSSIVSHYSTSYLFFFVFFISWFFIQIISKLIKNQEKLYVNNFCLKNEHNIIDSTAQYAISGFSKRYFTLGIVVIFFIMIFLWYSQVTGAAFHSGIDFITATFDSMGNFWIMDSRDQGITKAIGFGLSEKSILSKITFVIKWLSIIFIAIGVLTTLAKYRERIALPYINNPNSSPFLIQKIHIILFVFALICSAAMVVSVALPHVFIGYDIQRTYLQIMVILSSFFVLGGLELARFFRAKQYYLIVLAVLIPYMMLNTGVIDNLVGNPASLILNSQGKQYNEFYIHEQDVYSSRWLGDRREPGKEIDVDHSGRRPLMSQGRIRFSIIMADLASVIEGNREFSSYIYLRHFNIVDGMYISASEEKDFSKYWYRFSTEDKIYENGGSEIWFSPSAGTKAEHN